MSLTEALEIHGTVFKNGSAVLLARVVGADGSPLIISDVSAAQYSVGLLDLHDPDSFAAIEGHAEVELDVATLIFDSLQNDDTWDVDDTGYNFKHVLDVADHPAFPEAGRLYRVEFRLTPASGQVILVRFRLHAV
jgi:hypothetical protein